MDTFLVMPLFLALIMVVQHFDRKAQAALSSEEKARLLDFNTDTYKWHMGPLIVLLLAYGGFNHFRSGSGNVMTGLTIFIGLMAAQTIGFDRWHSRKLLTLGLPALYLVRTRRLRILQTAATLIFFLWIGGSAFYRIDQLRDQMEKLRVESPKAP